MALKLENAGFIRGKVSTVENNVKNLYQQNEEKKSLNSFLVGEAQPFEGKTDRCAKNSQGSKVKSSCAENSKITSSKVITQDKWKTVKFRVDSHGDKIKHGWNNRKSKECISESTATYSPKTNNRFEVLDGITTFDDEDTREEESYAGSNKIEYPKEK